MKEPQLIPASGSSRPCLCDWSWGACIYDSSFSTKSWAKGQTTKRRMIQQHTQRPTLRLVGNDISIEKVSTTKLRHDNQPIQFKGLLHGMFCFRFVFMVFYPSALLSTALVDQRPWFEEMILYNLGQNAVCLHLSQVTWMERRQRFPIKVFSFMPNPSNYWLSDDIFRTISHILVIRPGFPCGRLWQEFRQFLRAIPGRTPDFVANCDQHWFRRSICWTGRSSTVDVRKVVLLIGPELSSKLESWSFFTNDNISVNHRSIWFGLEFTASWKPHLPSHQQSWIVSTSMRCPSNFLTFFTVACTRFGLILRPFHVEPCHLSTRCKGIWSHWSSVLRFSLGLLVLLWLDADLTMFSSVHHLPFWVYPWLPIDELYDGHLHVAWFQTNGSHHILYAWLGEWVFCPCEWKKMVESYHFAFLYLFLSWRPTSIFSLSTRQIRGTANNEGLSEGWQEYNPASFVSLQLSQWMCSANGNFLLNFAFFWLVDWWTWFGDLGDLGDLIADPCFNFMVRQKSLSTSTRCLSWLWRFSNIPISLCFDTLDEYLSRKVWFLM